MAATAVYTAEVPDLTAGNSAFTFEDVPIGTAAAGRVVAVFTYQRIDSNTIRTLTSITVGGNASVATGPTTTNSGGSNSMRSASATFQIDAGDTADIVVTWSGTCTYCGIEVYAIYGADSATPHGTPIGNNTATSPTGTINVPAGGTLIAAAHSRDVSTAGSSWAWTGVTEDDDQVAIGNASTISVASDDFAVEQTGLTVTATYTGGGTWQHLLAMSFAPAADTGRTGTMAAQETGTDDAAAAGDVLVEGTLAATEVGADDATMSGVVPITGAMAAAEAGSDAFSGSGVGTAAVVVAQPPTGGWADRPHARDYDFLESAEIRRRRALEREQLRLSELDQRRLDRTAKKIARTLPSPGVVPATVMAAPAFDALLMVLRPSEGEIAALAQAIVERVMFLAEMQRQEDEEAEQIFRLMMEM